MLLLLLSLRFLTQEVRFRPWTSAKPCLYSSHKCSVFTEGNYLCGGNKAHSFKRNQTQTERNALNPIDLNNWSTLTNPFHSSFLSPWIPGAAQLREIEKLLQMVSFWMALWRHECMQEGEYNSKRLTQLGFPKHNNSLSVFSGVTIVQSKSCLIRAKQPPWLLRCRQRPVVWIIHFPEPGTGISAGRSGQVER